MSKRFIAMCLTVIFLLGASVNIFAATEEAVPVSGESPSDFADSNRNGQNSTGSTGQNQTQSQNTTNSQSGMNSDTTNRNSANAVIPKTTKTIDNSKAIV